MRSERTIDAEQNGAEQFHEGLSASAILAALRRERRLIVGLLLLGAVLGTAAALLSRERYTAESTFVPQSSENKAARLAGLAAQFGVSVGGGGKSESPDFYAALLTSRAVLEKTIGTEYVVRGDKGVQRGTLLHFYGLEEEEPAKRMPRALDVLAGSITARPDLRTGIVRLTTTAPAPDLAEAINRRLLRLVTEYNLTTRQTQAGAEREFVQARLADAQRELESSERALQSFMARNRSYEGSPELTFEFTRLQRRVDLRQQVYSGLARSFEDARIEEVRNTPLITLVDVPEGSARPGGLGAPLLVVLGLTLAGAVAVPLALMRQYLVARRASAETRSVAGRRGATTGAVGTSGAGEPRRWEPAAEPSPLG
jgi:uncharacterized protein involved in exopolysaccharide biosynthesis